MEDFNADRILQQQEVTPIQNMVAQIREINSPDSTPFKFEAPDINKGLFGGTGMKEQVQKPSFTREVPVTEAYDLVAGDWMAKFPTYKQGRDNAEYAAQNQTTGEKWANGVQKFGAKTLGAVVGGTAGIVYGVGAGISDGSWGSIYDNNFSNWLNDLDAKLNYQLPNYYTKQEQNAGVFGQTMTANFWTDKFLGGLSFTAGAIISEGIWGFATGGTSLATAGARLGGRLAGLGKAGTWAVKNLGEAKTLAGLAKMKGIYKAIDYGGDALQVGMQARGTAVTMGKIGEGLSIVGRTARSAGYEASVEALQYKKEAEELFYENFAKLNGREPDADEIAQFEKENEETANLVFASNMAIVGTSNLVGLGHVLNIKNPVNLGISDFINKKAFGYGIDAATKTVIKGSRKQILARNAFDYLVKPSLTEGLFEEGLQGVTNKTANKWIEHTYNPKYTNETFNQMEAFTDSLSEQYGSEAGWKDNMLGMLIGIAGGSVNVRGEQKVKQSELEVKASVDRTYTAETLQSMILPNRLQVANRTAGFSETALSEEAKGNLMSSHEAKVGAIVNMVNSKLVLGESIKDMTKEMKSHLDAITPAQWAETGIEQNEIEEVKTQQLTEFKELAQAWKTNKEYAQYMVGNKMVGEKDLEGTALEGIYGNFSKNAQIVEALAYQLTVGEQGVKAMKEMRETFGRELGYENARVLDLSEKLSAQTGKKNEEIKAWTKLFEEKTKARDEIAKTIKKLNDAPIETEGKELHKKKVLAAGEAFLAAEKSKKEAEDALQAIADELTATNTYDSKLQDIELKLGDTVTVQDLVNMEANVKKFNNIIEQQKSLNPQKAKYLEDLMQEYMYAHKMFQEGLFTQKALVSPQFKIENIDGWLSNMIKKGGSMNTETKEWFQWSIESYNDFKKKSMKSQTDKPTEDSVVTNEEFENFKENDEVSQETLENLAKKQRNGEELTKEELEIVNAKKTEIEEINKVLNTQTQKKSEAQINQEKIDALEAERRQKLAEVEPIIVEEQVTTSNQSEIEAKKADIERRRQKELNTPIQNFKNAKTKEDLIKAGQNWIGVNPYDSSDSPMGVRAALLTQGGFEKGKELFIEFFKKADEIRTKQINAKYDAELKVLEKTETNTAPQKQTTTKTVPNQAEIDKINKKYDEKINALKPSSKDKIAAYKKRIDDMLKGIYKDLIDTENPLNDKRPTQADIDEYRELQKLKKLGTKRGQELTKKLKVWKLMSTLTDNGYTSIVDLLDVIAQHETDLEQEDTKDTVTDKDAIEIVEKTLEDLKGTGSDNSYNIGNNSSEPVVAKLNNAGEIELSHLKAKYIVDQIGGDYKIIRKEKEVKNPDITKVQVGDRVEIDNMSFDINDNYRLVFDVKQFESRQQQLNLYLEPSQTFAGFTSVYSIFGEEGQAQKVKTPSQFTDKIDRLATFDVKAGDILTLHVDDVLTEEQIANGETQWNKTEKGGTINEFKIYLKDSQGRIVQNLKAQKGTIDKDFANIRLRAFQNWEAQGKPDKMDLGISVKVQSMLYGAPELLFSEGKLIDTPIEIDELAVIEAKGYVENGELFLDNKQSEKNTSLVYVSRLSKNNPNKKIPVITFKIGNNVFAFPVTMNKTNSPIEFDVLLNGTPQEMVKNINQAIIDKKIRTEKLTFEDISISYSGEVQLSENAEKVREAFANKTTFVDALRLADKNYKVDNLAKTADREGDASIRIDLSRLEDVFSAPKVVFDLTSAEIKQPKEVKYENMTDFENALSDIALELDRHWRINAQTLYVINKEGDILEGVPYTNAFDNNPPIKVLSNLDAQHNVQTLREALTNKDGKISVSDLPNVVKKAIGLQKLKEAEHLLKQYDAIKAQQTPKGETVKDGLDNIDESCNK